MIARMLEFSITNVAHYSRRPMADRRRYFAYAIELTCPLSAGGIDITSDECLLLIQGRC
jgi:hypothetical protein